MNKLTSTRSSLPSHESELLDQFDKSTTVPSRSHRVEFSGSNITLVGFGSIDISVLYSTLSENTLNGFKKTILSLASAGKLSALTLIARIRGVRLFIKTEKESSFTTEGISQYFSHCQETGSAFGPFKLLLLDWHSLGFYGVSDDIADLLRILGTPNKSRPAGSRVRSDNPEEGWYTEQEYDDIVFTLWDDYENEKNDLWNTTLCLLAAQFGRRPIQYTQLKIGDLKEKGESFGVTGKRIEFSGAKERRASGFRSTKKEVHPIGEALWQLCQLQASSTIYKFEANLGRNLTEVEASNLPLFSFKRTSDILRHIELAKRYANPSENFLASKILHISPERAATVISRRSRGSPVISHRTGETLIENAYRMRYTRARQLARMGIPRATLQFWLGHDGPESLDAYYDDPAERARVLNDAIEPLMAPVAQAFFGTIRDSEASAMRGDDPSSRVELDGREDLTVGNCGEHGFCHASVPIPCYRCSKFQPWVYGPHQEVLDRLLERQNIENNVPLYGQGKRLLLPLQLGKDIAAVRLVIHLCEQRKKVLEGTNV